MHQISKIYFVIKLCVFRASSVPIIRSYMLYARQLVRVMQVMWPLPRRVMLEQSSNMTLPCLFLFSRVRLLWRVPILSFQSSVQISRGVRFFRGFRAGIWPVRQCHCDTGIWYYTFSQKYYFGLLTKIYITYRLVRRIIFTKKFSPKITPCFNTSRWTVT